MNTTGIQALLNQVYDVKFSKHTPLVVVLLSMIYTVFRSGDYLSRTFNLPWAVTWATAAFIELLVLAAAAAVFIALRAAYVAELKQQDSERALWGFRAAFLVLGLAFLALLFVAGADAWAVTQQIVPSFIMVLIQASQMLLIACFIIAADLDERDKLRTWIEDWREEQRLLEARRKNGECRWCGLPQSPSNKARHEKTCPQRV
jgi:hypothetical protein